MKKTFIEELIKITKKNRNTILLVNDLGFGMIEPFKNLFPKNIFNAGISEQSMIGYASGLAATGKHVFVYSIGNFSTFRCAEQIRNDVDYHNFPVTIVAAGSGVGYGNLGYSHHLLQDYGLIRSFPNMLIAAPGDNSELKSCMNFLSKKPMPSYIRLEKSLEYNIHEKTLQIKPGKIYSIYKPMEKKKYDRAYLTTGPVINFLINKIKFLKIPQYPIYSLPMWGMKFKIQNIEILKKYKEIIVVEDHLKNCGFFSWISENNFFKNIKSFSLSSEVIGKVGSQKYLMNFLKKK